MVDNADLDDLLKGQDDSIASERVNEKTLKLKTVYAKSAALIGKLNSTNIAFNTIELEKIGRLSLGDIKSGHYIKLSENEFKI